MVIWHSLQLETDINSQRTTPAENAALELTRIRNSYIFQQVVMSKHLVRW
jgi:hypothetical protein